MLLRTRRSGGGDHPHGEARQPPNEAMVEVRAAACAAHLGAAYERVQRCTSRQQNAHITESRVVLYRWHPWHGRSVFIFGTVTKGEQAVFRCALEPADAARPLEVPQWMFDAAACCRVVLAATPSVSVEVLRELDQLISAVSLPSGPEVLQAEHLSLRDSGGACARRKRSTITRSAGALSPAADNAAVGEPSGRSSRADTEAPGAAAPGTSPPSALRAPRRAGGGR